jgi:hypothetical protein
MKADTEANILLVFDALSSFMDLHGLHGEKRQALVSIAAVYWNAAPTMILAIRIHGAP